MVLGEGGDPFLRLKESHSDYTVFDGRYERIGKVDEVFVDEEDRPLYIGITSSGILDTTYTLVPVEIIRINDKRQVVEVADSKENVQHAPSFADSDELTPEMEEGIRAYFGLPPLHPQAFPQAPPLEGDYLADKRIDLAPGERDHDREVSGDAPMPDRLIERHERVADHEGREPDTADPAEPSRGAGQPQQPEAPASEQAHQREMRRIRRRA